LAANGYVVFGQMPTKVYCSLVTDGDSCATLQGPLVIKLICNTSEEINSTNQLLIRLKTWNRKKAVDMYWSSLAELMVLNPFNAAGKMLMPAGIKVDFL